MNVQRILLAASIAGVALAACSGNMGSGATPPVSAPAGVVPGGVSPQSATGAIPPVPSQAAAGPQEAHRVATLTLGTPIALPTAAGFGGTLCLIASDATTPCGSAVATPLPSAVPSATPSANPSASATPLASTSPTATPHGRRVAGGATLQLALHALPTAAPARDSEATDGATEAMLAVDAVPAVGATLPGLSALTLTLPAAQLVTDRRFALVLYDGDPKATRGAHRKGGSAASATAIDSTVTGTTLTFNDATAPLALQAKHHYTFVLYADNVTPATAAPAAAVPPPVAPAVSGAVNSTPVPPGETAPPTNAAGAPTPYVSYPNGASTPITAATPSSTR